MHPRRLHYDVCFLLFQENTDSLAEQPHGAFPRKVSAGCYMKVELYQRHRLHRKLDFVFNTTPNLPKNCFNASQTGFRSPFCKRQPHSRQSPYIPPPEFFHIFFIINLLKCFVRICFQVINMGGNLYLKNKRPAPQRRAFHHDIRTAVTRFPVRFHPVLITLA